MKRDESLYLWDMIDHARAVHEKVRHIDRDQFDMDENLQLAITRLLQIIGEAAWRVDETTKASHPDIPWNSIERMRHKLVHDYFRLSVDVVWTTAVEDMVPLVAQLEHVLADERSN